MIPLPLLAEDRRERESHRGDWTQARLNPHRRWFRECYEELADALNDCEGFAHQLCEEPRDFLALEAVEAAILTAIRGFGGVQQEALNGTAERDLPRLRLFAVDRRQRLGEPLYGPWTFALQDQSRDWFTALRNELADAWNYMDGFCASTRLSADQQDRMAAAQGALREADSRLGLLHTRLVEAVHVP